jgi:signal transduction histidine kinase
MFAELRQQLSAPIPPGGGDEEGARRQWWAALAVLQETLLETDCLNGIWLASPLPALYEPTLLQRFPGWVWTPPKGGGIRPELPGDQAAKENLSPKIWQLLLQEGDGTDPLLLLITADLQVALALHGEPHRRQLVVSFEQNLIAQLLQGLGGRLAQENPLAAQDLQQHLEKLGPLHSSLRGAELFWPRLAERLATAAPSITLMNLPPKNDGASFGSDQLGLLEALAHEVRTPLATIRTLIRSLLKREDLPPLAQTRLSQIDAECSEQIDRFGLIFYAAEAQRQPRAERLLARTDLAALLLQLQPNWANQLRRRELQLELKIQANLPAVMSDPALLEKMLAGLMDRFSRSLRAGAKVKVELQAAGEKLKLRFSGGQNFEESCDGLSEQTAEAKVGAVLTWDPATGSLQLSPHATQQLFASLGGRFTERRGSSFTLYLPVANPPIVEGCEESNANTF